MEIRAGIDSIGGFFEVKHVIYRTAESDNSPRIIVSVPANSLSCTVEESTRRSARVTALLLQLRKITQIAKARAASGNARDAGGTYEEAAHAQRDLLFSNPSVVTKRDRSCLRWHHGEVETRGIEATVDGGRTDEIRARHRELQNMRETMMSLVEGPKVIDATPKQTEDVPESEQ